MPNYITFARNGFRSVPAITENMQQEIQVLRARHGEPVPDDADVLIRWGSMVIFPAKKTINKTAAIGAASNKGRARLALQAAGVPTPPTVLWPTRPDFDFPWVFRPSQHHAGNDFYLVRSSADLLSTPAQGGWYISQFFDKTHEYRVHVGHGKVLLVNEKVPREGEEDKRNEPVWNHATNNFYFQVLRWNSWPLSVVSVALHAAEVLGLDFAAVDVMSSDDRVVVCEVNTAPTLEDYAATRYALYFDWLLSGGAYEPHFEVSEGHSYQDFLFTA